MKDCDAIVRTAQVSAFVYRESPTNPGGAEYLALHRTPERGNFWQSVTGGVESSDSSIEAAAYRELGEELGVEPEAVEDTGYSFTFDDEINGTLREFVVGAKVASDAEVKLSDEHDAGMWVSYAGLRRLITVKWPENGEGLDKTDAVVRRGLPNNPERRFDHDRWSLVIVKPDAFELGIEDEITDRLANAGLTQVAGVIGHELTHRAVDEIWVPPKDLDPWYHATVQYMLRRPVDAYLYEGPDATTAAKAIKNEVRDLYDKRHQNNEAAPVEKRVESLMHCSDRMDELARQAVLFFGGGMAVNSIVEAHYSNQPAQ